MAIAHSSVVWDGRDDAGRTVPAGMYFLSVSRNREVEDVETLIVLR